MAKNWGNEIYASPSSWSHKTVNSNPFSSKFKHKWQIQHKPNDLLPEIQCS